MRHVTERKQVSKYTYYLTINKRLYFVEIVFRKDNEGYWLAIPLVCYKFLFWWSNRIEVWNLKHDLALPKRDDDIIEWLIKATEFV